MSYRGTIAALGLTIGPAKSSPDDYTTDLVDPELAPEFKATINRFANLMGVPKLVVNSRFDLADAERAMAAFFYVIKHYWPLDKSVSEVKSGVEASIARQGGLGKWFVVNGESIYDKLVKAADNIDAGAWKRKQPGWITPALVFSLVVGAAALAA